MTPRYPNTRWRAFKTSSAALKRNLDLGDPVKEDRIGTCLQLTVVEMTEEVTIEEDMVLLVMMIKVGEEKGFFVKDISSFGL